MTGKGEREGLDSGLSVDWKAAFGDRERGERDLTVTLSVDWKEESLW